MLKIIFVAVLCVAATQGGWFFGPSDQEFCQSRAEPWWRESKYNCVRRILRGLGFSDSNAQKLFDYSATYSGTPGQRGYPKIADSNSRKALCKAAKDCSCRIIRDWCRD